MMLQRDAVDFMMKNNKVNPANPFHRVIEQITKIPGAYSKYADWVMETLLHVYETHYERQKQEWI